MHTSNIDIDVWCFGGIDCGLFGCS